jgi:membrane protease YdiL (CAAX protease family)
MVMETKDISAPQTSGSIIDRLRFAVNWATTDPFLLGTLYLMPVAFVDPYGMLYSLGALALLGLMYVNPVASRQTDKRSLLERLACWSIPILILCYQWLVEPEGGASLKADQIFSLQIAEGNSMQLFPGFAHLAISYLFPLLVICLLGLFGKTFRLGRKTALFAGLIVVPIVLRNVLAVETLSGDALAVPSLAIIGLQAFYVPGLGEELLYRGLVFNLFARRLKPAYAVVLSSLVFTLAHYNLIRNFWLKPNLAVPTAFNLAAIWVLGCSMAIIYNRTKSLIPCIVFHGAIDGGFRYLFYAALLAMGVRR